jgi:hypothetical protein
MDGIMMTDTIRCPACRGAKKVPKLGGMIGECNTCVGKGSILLADKPVKVEVTIEDVISKELINAVADCVPASSVTPIASQPDIKIDGKKALYKRKTAAK